jgi:hypothetical protein
MFLSVGFNVLVHEKVPFSITSGDLTFSFREIAFSSISSAFRYLSILRRDTKN